MIYDNTQYKHREWQNRNQVLTANGPCWLTVPVKHPPFPVRIDEVEVFYESGWQEKHRKTIVQSYRRSRYFDVIWPKIQEMFDLKLPRLLTLNELWISSICQMLGLRTQMFLASGVPEAKFIACETAVERLICVVKWFGGDVYLSGPGGLGYMKPELYKFADSGIEVRFQQFTPPVYRQMYGYNVPNLSMIDMLFNVGLDSLKLLREDR